MDTAVVDDVGLYHAVAAGLEDAGQRVTQQYVAQVSQMQRLVGVRRRVLHHHQRRFVGGGGGAVIGGGGDVAQHLAPVAGADNNVQKSVYRVGALHFVDVGFEPRAYLGGDGGGGLAGRLYPGEYDNRQVAGKLLAGFLQLYFFGGGICAVQFVHGLAHAPAKFFLNRHVRIISK